jgi:hypothetical protein
MRFKTQLLSLSKYETDLQTAYNQDIYENIANLG